MECQDENVWLTAVKTNDASTIETILMNTSRQERNFLLNREYSPTEYLPTTKTTYTRLQVRHAIVIAMVCNAPDVAAVLIRYGADVTLREAGGNNIVHVMALVCDLHPEMDEAVAEYYRWFVNQISVDEISRLLLEENGEHLRPLESAAQKGHLQLMRAIFETRGVYLTQEKEVGVFTVQTFDVSDYEAKLAPRYGKSPLAFITFMTQDTMSRNKSTDILTWTPLHQWYQLKLVSSTPLVLGWIVVRFFLMLAYYVLMYSYDPSSTANLNETFSDNDQLKQCSYSGKISLSRTQRDWIYMYISVNSWLIILEDVWEVVYILRRKRPYVLYKNALRVNTAVSIYFYRICQHLLVWVFAVSAAIALHNPQDQRLVIATPIVNMAAAIGSFACILYFLQLAPVIGPYVQTIHKMLMDLLVFMFLFLLCLLPLAYYFLVFFSVNTKTGCIEDFSSFWTSVYSSVLIMLNMIDFLEFDVSQRYILFVAHVCFVFIVAILLLNFLIAIMSTSAAEVAESRTIVQRLERLQVFYVVEFRTRWFLSRYYGYVALKRGLLRKGRVILTNIELTSSLRTRKT